ncbi:MAG: hypothetical protein GXP63_03680 [DPANN group archaeon]|nr:hypothetical protein [DPANN group archaeon]
MNKHLIFSVMIAALLSLSAAFAFTPVVGSDLNIIVETENFVPMIWLHQDGCTLYHNNADGGGELVERVENYAFEGEQIKCRFLAMDKNGADTIRDVYVGLSEMPTSNPADFSIEASCQESCSGDPTEYNARVDGELITTLDCSTMRTYDCTFTVETQNSQHGEYYLSGIVEDLDGDMTDIDENTYWFLNPLISLTITGDVDFGTVTPGTNSYSSSILVENAAESGSGVLLDMAISGTDFYDPTNSGAKCPDSNVLNLRSFAYYASNGAYHTMVGSLRANLYGQDGLDEGYYSIPYETADPDAREEIMQDAGLVNLGGKDYQAGNVLSPGAEISVTFRLALPEPCNGDFSDGSIYFWGSAI